MIKKAHSDTISSAKPRVFWRWFWLLFLVGSLAYGWYSFYAPANEVDWAIDMETAREDARYSGKNMLLFFTGEWCVPCRIMKREVFADQEVSDAINAQIVPVMLDVDDPVVQELVQQYQVGVTPLTIFTNADGAVLDYAVGKIDKTKFLEMLNNAGAVRR